LPWLSGSATWSFFAATQYILGIQPDYEGLVIDPCIPSDWKGFKVSRRFRGKDLNIQVKNESGVQKGVQKIILNGEEIKGNCIHINMIKDQNEVVVVMG
jgi:N,N'-diacetylchitobiose phosphorylase